MHDNRPRVVLASRLFAPEASAATFRMTALVRALADAADVTVITTRPPTGASGSHVDGVRIRRAPVLRDRSGAIRGVLQYLSFDVPLLFRIMWRRANVIVAEAPPTTGFVALVVSRLRRSRFIYYPGDVWTDGVAAMGGTRLLVGVMRWLESCVCRGADAVLAVSPEVAARLRELGARRVVDVGNGVDTDVFTPEVPGPPGSLARYFVYTGTMSEWQRPEIFVEALALLGEPGVELRFFGQGSSLDAVRAAAERTGVTVRIGGTVTPEESASWIRGAVAALVSIVPGIGYDMARPTKTYAAAAVGTPVLYAGAEAGARVVADGALGEVAGFDARDIAQRMRKLLDRPPTAAERRHRVMWARANASLAAVGRRAAETVMDVALGLARTRV